MRNPHTSKAYEYMRKRLLSGALPPGAFLSAQSLSKDIGVSRTPVREALRQLEYDELVTIVPKLGAVVKTLDREQFQELLGYRQALETHAAAKAAELRRPEEVEQLGSILEGMRRHGEAVIQDPRNLEALQLLSDADARFHRLLFAMARNTFIRENLERAHVLQRMLTLKQIEHLWPGDEVLKTNVATVLKEHTNIWEAIRDGDPDRAQAAMSQHMSNFAGKLSKHSGNFFDQLPHQGSAEILM